MVSESSHALPLELSAIWPEGLSDLTIRMAFAQSELDLSDVVAALADLGAVYRQREAGLLFPLHGVAESGGFWGRVEISPAPEFMATVADTAMEFSIRGEEEPPIAPAEALPLHEFPSLLERIAKNGLENEIAVVAGRFTFTSATWKPAITLPVQLPGVLDDASGAPEITGFEFTFRDLGSELKRAEISMDPYRDRFSVKIFVAMNPLPADTMIHRACHLLGQHLSLMAVRVARAEVAEHV